jgi:hypothetical protein
VYVWLLLPVKSFIKEFVFILLALGRLCLVMMVSNYARAHCSGFSVLCDCWGVWMGLFAFLGALSTCPCLIIMFGLEEMSLDYC